MKKQKGDDKMEHKDIWLVLGLTVILAVAVSLSTVGWTGNATFISKLNPCSTTNNCLQKVMWNVWEGGRSWTQNGAISHTCSKLCGDRKYDCVYALFTTTNPNYYQDYYARGRFATDPNDGPLTNMISCNSAMALDDKSFLSCGCVNK